MRPYGRAEPRDFLDVDSALQSGRYTREQLLDLAAAADTGFDIGMFADSLGALHSITDTAFEFYGITPAELASMRNRFEEWRGELLGMR